MTIPIIPAKKFREEIPDMTMVWHAGVFFKAKQGEDMRWSQSLFIPGVPSEIEAFLMQEFGKVQPLTSIGKRLYERATEGLRYGRYLTGPAAELSARLLFGGREFAIPGTHKEVYHIDRNSAYPACAAALDLPVPYFTRYVANPDQRAVTKYLRREGFGFYRVRCTEDVPVQGVLPIDRGIYRYPRTAGEVFEGVWTHNELRYALEWGYRVERAWWLFHAPVCLPYLRDFQMEMRKKREEWKGTIGEKIYKVIANKLIGRLAMKPRPMYLYRANPEGATMMRGARWDITKVNTPSWGNRLHAAMVAAEQRCKMHHALVSSKDPVYAFTDSLVCRELPAVQIGNEMGQWKLFSPVAGDYTVRGLGQYRSVDRGANRGGHPW